jgi:hypothetical protein
VKDRYERITQDLVFGAADTVKTATVHFRGEVKNLALRMPNFTNSVTGTLALNDEDGITFYSQAAIPENADSPYTVERYFSGGLITVSLTLSGAPGGTGGTATLVLHAKGER